ncbi:unnamed protein product [Caenorhabditis sp. 36 PRJEB53466]|nr:unnamed protein product [Caenorhabditis sp. 36 PRJEB53466]
MFAPEEHRCPICDKRLCSKAQLYGHMNIHLDVKPHQCEICDRSFNSTASLQSHSFARGNTDGFKCSHCNVPARTFKCFKEHMRVFHSDIPLKSVECPVCKKTVQSTWELEKHMSNHREKSGGDEMVSLSGSSSSERAGSAAEATYQSLEPVPSSQSDASNFNIWDTAHYPFYDEFSETQNEMFSYLLI